LKDAVAQRGDEPQPNLARSARDHDVLAEAAVQHVRHRVGVGDNGNRAVGIRTMQEEPRVGALGVGCRERVLEREAPLRQERLPRRQDPWISRLVQIQAARIVPRQQAERLDRHRFADIGEVERRASLARVGIVDDRQQRLHEELIAADARCAIGGLDGAVAAESVDGDQDERG
jgi:hypothetical protein